MRLPVGAQVGEYEILRFIGQGTFGTVYQAVHPVIGKRGAVKVLRYDAVDDADTVQRFKGEALAVNAIEHPNIVDIFSFGHLDDGRPYLIMEYLDGCSLEELLEQHGGLLPADTILPILQEVALAVDAAHEAGVVHRDLKPDNIFISRTGSGAQAVKVLDFGVAKLMFQSLTATDPGMPMGTPLYMAPEQFMDEREVDYRIDVYAFGVTAFHCLTGEFPVDADSYAGIVRRHLSGERTRASELDPALAHFDEALQCALANEAEDRFQSLLAAYQALAAAHYPVGQISPTGPVPPVSPTGPVPSVLPAAKSSSTQATLMGPLGAQRARERAASAPVPSPLHPAMHPPPPVAERSPSQGHDAPAVPAPDAPPVAASTDLVPAPAAPPGPAQSPGAAAGIPVGMPAGTSEGSGASGPLARSTLDSSSAELLSQYKLRRPLVKPLLLAAVAISLITGVAVLWPIFMSDGPPRNSSASLSETLEEAVAALGAKRWDDARAAAESVLQDDADHAQAKHIVEQARQEASNQEHYESLLAAADGGDLPGAKESLTAIPAFSVYASGAKRAFDKAADRWFAEQRDVLRDLISGRKPSKKDCATARRLVRKIRRVRTEDYKEATQIYRKSRCRGKITTGSKSAGNPAELVEQALAAAKNKNYGRAFSLCKRALDGDQRTSRPHDLATCTTVACKTNEAAAARSWYERVPSSSVHRKNARKSCERAGVSLR